MNDDPIEFGFFRAKQRFQAVGRRVHSLQRDLSIEETMQGEVQTVGPLFSPDTSNASATYPELGTARQRVAEWRELRDAGADVRDEILGCVRGSPACR